MTSFSFNPRSPSDYKPLEAYGVIGDSRTAILIGADGSVDWACLPDFDSPSVFGAILDPSAGHFRINPAEPYTSTQYYERGTNVLVTEFRCGSGVVRLRDFMPYVPHRSVPMAEIYRRIEGVKGSVPMELSFAPRFEYGQKLPDIERTDHGVRAAISDAEAIVLATEIPLSVTEHTVHGTFTLQAGDEMASVADWGARQVHPVAAYQSDRRLWLVRKFWRDWTDRLTYHGRYREVVERSLLALKLMVYEPTGAIVAAPTMSLPEWPGGQRNWDYRYSWVRDSAFILQALFEAQFVEEGTKYLDWLLNQTLEGGPIQIMYGIRGERHLPERELPLRGYRDSRPVRVGNGAAEQFQLDIFGSLLDAALRYDRHGGLLSIREWERLAELTDDVCKRWREPDNGIWEARNEPRHYTYSKVWAWVALDRACRLARQLEVDAPVDRWRAVAGDIREEVLKKAWNDRKQSFTQSYETDELDASVLTMASVGFIQPDDPRFASTLRAIQSELTAGSYPLLYRYKADDGVGGKEGAFLLTSFWMVEAIALTGDLKEARAALSRLIAMLSPLGLYAEEIHPEENLAIGNFPQGFSHLGLVNAIFKLEALKRRDEGWSDNEVHTPKTV